MFGDNTILGNNNLTPQESSIKLQQEQEQESTMILQQIQMVGLLEDSDHTAAAYSSLPHNSNHDVQKALVVVDGGTQAEIKVPLTTKSAAQVIINTSSGTGGLLASKQIENIDSTPTHADEKKLPKFKISLQELQRRNLEQKNKNKLAMEESTGLGLMLSSRQLDIQKLPRHHKKPVSLISGSSTPVQDGGSGEQQIKKSKKHVGTNASANVKSVDDVLSVLSAKSPKFQARQLTGCTEGSQKLLSIDSPNKFSKEEGSLTMKRLMAETGGRETTKNTQKKRT